MEAIFATRSLSLSSTGASRLPPAVHGGAARADTNQARTSVFESEVLTAAWTLEHRRAFAWFECERAHRRRAAFTQRADLAEFQQRAARPASGCEFVIRHGKTSTPLTPAGAIILLVSKIIEGVKRFLAFIIAFRRRRQQAVSMTGQEKGDLAMPSNLDREWAAYVASLPDFKKHAGKFMLVHGDKVAGLFDTYRDALAAGYEQFQLEPFLVKQISCGGGGPTVFA